MHCYEKNKEKKKFTPRINDGNLDRLFGRKNPMVSKSIKHDKNYHK